MQDATQGRTIWNSDGTTGPALICPPPSTQTPTTPRTPINLANIPSGRYAYQPEGAQAQFYHIDNLRRSPNPNNPKWDGWIFVKAEYGGGGSEKAGSQRPGQDEYQGPRSAAMAAILNDPQAACSLYGKLIGKCGICGRTLTNEESRTSGIGPICAQKAGW